MPGMDITRRAAVKLAGVAAAATALELVVDSRAQVAKAASDRLVYGLIGAGMYGQHLLARLNNINSGICAAICDIDETALRRALQGRNSGPRGYADYRELLARKDVDAVLVATPLYLHFQMVREALQAGKHVFCENSLVFKLEEALALKELAAAKPDLVLQTGLQRRYSQFYQIARQMVSKGMLGEVTHIQTQWNSNLGWTMRPDQPKEKNWRLLREFSGGLVSERVSHQVDVANWMFGDSPEFVVGVGGLDWKKDGRDVYDNVSLIFRYPYGQKLNATAISTNRHMALLNGTRKESGELIMGTDGSIEITLGDDGQPALGMWFVEPGTKIERAAGKNEAAFPAGATIAQATRDQRGFPILLASDQLAGDESFLAREMKYARRWLYAKGIALPQEDRSAVDAQLEGFFESCQTGKPVKADLDAGINASVATIMANRAMDESRKVLYSEMERKKT